jgi:hypothetical protein
MRGHMLDDVTIDFVRFRRNAYEAHQGRWREVHRAIGDETDRELASP